MNLNSLEHAPSVGISDYIANDFYSGENIEKNILSRTDHYNDLMGSGTGDVV
jgi:hypothetical protein